MNKKNSHAIRSSFRKSGLIVLVLSTCRLISFAAAFRRSAFHLAFSSRRFISAPARSPSFADDTRFSAVLAISYNLLLSRDWSILLFICVAVSAEHSNFGLSMRSALSMNSTFEILNSSFGSQLKCASKGDRWMVFCLFHLKSRLIVLRHNSWMCHSHPVT